MTGPAAIRRVELLASLPLLRCFEAAEREALVELFVEESHPRGEVVCREGDEGTCLYVVLDGELEVKTGGEDGRVVQRLGPGDFFGETSLLLGGPRTATVVVRRAAQLLALDRAAFERAFLQNARALEHISRVLSRRLATTTRGDVTPEGTMVVAVTGEPGLCGKSLVAATLAEILRDLSRLDVALVQVEPLPHGPRSNGPHPLAGIGREARDAIEARLERERDRPARLRVGVSAADAGRSSGQALDSLVAALAGSFAFVVLDVGVVEEGLVRAAETVADVLVRIVAAAAPEPPSQAGGRRRVFQVVNLHNRGSTAVPINHCEPFVVPDDPTLDARDPVAHARHLRDVRRARASAPLQRLARKILGMTVGVALGGGAAFGIAHVGVLQVLEANGVPIDVLAGTSMGSVVALAYAAGTTPEEMAKLARRLDRPLPILSALDVTLTRRGHLAGRRMVDLLMPFLGQARCFEDLVWPARAVATDIEHGERVQIGTGPLRAALQASCSVPVIWSPVRLGERVLVDGVLVDPVRAEVAYEMGADLCVAVNVIPRPDKEAETFLTKLSRQVGRFNPFSYVGEARHLPNLLEIYMNSMQVLWHELGHFRAICADVRIHPNLSRFTWTDFHRPVEIMELGAAAAEQALPEIRRVLAEKSAQRTRRHVPATA